jgi:hypothetical protein
MNMRTRALALLLALTCCLSFAVAQAGAVEYANHVGVESGANYFSPYEYMYAAETTPYGEAIGCAGIRGYGLYCPPNSHEAAGYVLGGYVYSEAYIHNHATYTSYFNGYYY